MQISNRLLISALALAAFAACDSDDTGVVTLPDAGSGASTAFARVDLASTQTDPDLVNSWGITTGAGGFWIANNGTGKASIYDGAGKKLSAAVAALDLGAGLPTGVARNNIATDFLVGGQPALFLFARLDGAIEAWNPTTAPAGTLVIPSHTTASYTGVAVGRDTAGVSRLYAANFKAGTIDVWDNKFAPITLANGFVDPQLPAHFSPFNVMQLSDGAMYVAYALPDAQGDETKAPGLGVVDKFDTTGKLLARIASGGPLNAPWGMAISPATFGPAANALLVGNFGDGRITAYATSNNQNLGQLLDSGGGTMVVDGLWGITFGDNANSGVSTSLYFAAGPNNETTGLFGRIDVAQVTN
jgi:uncharacterized protein (TIGR03118 family)